MLQVRTGSVSSCVVCLPCTRLHIRLLTVCCHNSCTRTLRIIIKSTIFVSISHGIPDRSKVSARQISARMALFIIFSNHSTARFIATHCTVVSWFHQL
jgi:hypothetical protein